MFWYRGTILLLFPVWWNGTNDIFSLCPIRMPLLIGGRGIEMVCSLPDRSILVWSHWNSSLRGWLSAIRILSHGSQLHLIMRCISIHRLSVLSSIWASSRSIQLNILDCYIDDSRYYQIPFFRKSPRLANLLAPTLDHLRRFCREVYESFLYENHYL